MKLIPLLLYLFVSTAIPVHAEQLQVRLGGEALYDPARNLTWLADADFLGNSGWHIALTKLADINAIGLYGFHDWRLPTTALPDPSCSNSQSNGVGCIGSEMGHLFYEVLGGTANRSILAEHGDQFSLFKNVQPSYYWSQTENLDFPGPITFYFGTGMQDISNNYDSGYHSWLVRNGDVVPIPVPPSSMTFLTVVILCSKRIRRRTSEV